MIELPTESEPVRIIEGDCLAVLPLLPAGCVDLVLVDPPYGIGLEVHSPDVCTDGSRRLRQRPGTVANDHSLDLALAIIEWADDEGLPLVAFASPHKPLPGVWRNILAWDKGPAVGGGGDTATCWKRSFELVYTRRNKPLNGARDEGVLRFPLNTGSDFAHHPCQKPVALLRYLIRQLTDPGDVILDPTGGSGSTAVACVIENRRCILIEREPAYVEIARRRVADAMGTGLLAGIV